MELYIYGALYIWSSIYMELYRGGNLKDVAAAQGLAEQKGANFLKHRIFPRQSGKMGNRVCKSLPRLVFSFTRKKFEVEFSQAL